MMPRRLALLLLAMTVSGVVVGQEKLTSGARTFRPELTAVTGDCLTNLRVAQAGIYLVAKGDLIEIDYSFYAPRECTWLTKPTCVSSNKEILQRADIATRLLYSDQPGTVIQAFYFKAAKKGQATLTLTVDNSVTQYHITVGPP